MDQHDDPVSDGLENHPTALDELHETEAEFHAAQAEAATREQPLLPESEPMRSIFRFLGTVEEVVGSLLLVLILILVLAQVALRYIPGASAPWSGELARLSMVWATFLLAGYLIAYPPHHIAIKVIDYVVKGRWLAGVKLFVNLVILGTCAVLIYGSYTLVTTTVDQVTPAGELSLRFVNSIPLIGLILVAIRVVLAIVIRDIPALRNGSEEPA
ncbi:MAG TPA: TRAP transporter small permease [Acidimicrobiia bacterium]|nr:TRAP transporter small permease [Acidimicrobiia bacterium]